MSSLLTRTLKLGDIGDDVYGVKRSVARLLGGSRLHDLEDSADAVKRTFGGYFTKDVNAARAHFKLSKTGKVDQALWAKLDHDAFTIALMNSYINEHPLLKIVYPHPQEARSTVCQGLHPTAGLLGNWACDFCAPGGTTVMAVESGWIQRLSGHDPSSGVTQGSVFGWSVYLRTKEGYVYYYTHLGSRTQGLNPGDAVQAGDKLGAVGHWPHDEGRSHTHLGVTSPLGATDARRRITTVSKAPRV